MPLSSPVEEQAQIVLQVTALTKCYVGQIALAGAWSDALGKEGLKSGQILRRNSRASLP